VTVAVGDVEVAPPRFQGLRVTRRTWLSAAAIAASLALAAGVWFFSPGPKEILTPGLIAEWSQEWQQELERDQSVQWNSDFASVRRFRQLLDDRFLVRPTGWTNASAITETETTAFQFKVDGKSATLFIVDASSSDISSILDYPPAEPIAGSWGNRAVSSWASGNELFVLVMDDAGMYPKLVNRTLPMLAIKHPCQDKRALHCA